MAQQISRRTSVYTTYTNGVVYRWTNFGANFSAQIGADDNSTFGEPKDNPRIGFYAPFTGNGVDAKLYFESWKLFTSIDRGNTWTPTSADDLTTGDPDVLNTRGTLIWKGASSEFHQRSGS